MPIFLSEDDVAALLTMPEAVAAVADAFAAQSAGGGANHPRGRFFLPNGVLHHMAAALPAKNVMGTKTYASFGGGTRFWVQLFSSETGELLALIEADRLGQMRTGAATGVAARFMAQKDASAAAILGTGWQARSQAMALRAALPGLREIHAFGRDTERRLLFCREMTDLLEIPVTPAPRIEAALHHAQVIVCATTAREPILRGEMLTPGQFVAAVGANRMTVREIDEDVVARADVIAVDDIDQARIEAAELVFAHERRKFAWERARTLADIAAGSIPGRIAPEQITLFKSLGVALEDVAVAAVVYEKAVARKIGKPLG